MPKYVCTKKRAQTNTIPEIGSQKRRSPFQFEVQLPSQASRTSFNAIIEEARRLMTPQGQRKLLLTIDSMFFDQPKHLTVMSNFLSKQLPWLESSGKVSFYMHVAIMYKLVYI